jgi:hypothetical protein
MNFLKGIVLGFIAGAIATLTMHEFVSWLFNNPSLWSGWDRVSWNTELVDRSSRVWPGSPASSASGTPRV